jgi:hypothetical protein
MKQKLYTIKAKDIARTKQEMGNSFAESDAGRSIGKNELKKI